MSPEAIEQDRNAVYAFACECKQAREVLTGAPAPKTLLVIFNIADEDDRCRLFLPYWERSGCPLLFSSPYDAPSRLDGVFHLHVGRKIPQHREQWWFYQARVLATMEQVLALPFDSYIFTQYDSICLGPLPRIGPTASIHNMACGPVPEFKAKRGLHPPWCFGRDTLKRFVAKAKEFPIETTEQGIMDRWLALILEEMCGPYPESPYEHASWSWSCNSIDTPEWVAAARTAIARGALFVHGVKNETQLKQILE